MSKFAKLFDVADTQVLCLVTRNDEDAPCLRMMTEVDGFAVSADVGFGKVDEGKAFELAEKGLRAIGQKDADDFHANMAAHLGGEQ